MREVRDFFGEIVFTNGDPPRCGSGRGAQPRPGGARLRPALRGSRAYVELCMEVMETVG